MFNLFLMNSLCLFILLCVVSIPLFTIEFVGNLFSGQVYQFRFFTILTNILCWIYFITKLIFVLISRKNQDVLFLCYLYSYVVFAKEISKNTFRNLPFLFWFCLYSKHHSCMYRFLGNAYIIRCMSSYCVSFL